MAGVSMGKWRVGWLALVLGTMVSSALQYTVAGDINSAGGSHLQVIDGDTLDLNGRVIDLLGIDAPELGQWCLDGTHAYPCGLNAAFELRKIIAMEQVECLPSSGGDDIQAYECATPTTPLSERLVEEGLAVARSGMSRRTAQDIARGVPLGIWRGKFIDPRDWRAGSRLPEELDSGSCPIIGADVDGVRVYVVPTDPAYAEWDGRSDIRQRFCSDEAARADGLVHLTGR